MAGFRILSVLLASLLGATCVHAQCSGVPLSITDGDGYVTTPNYPDLYPDNSQCGWLIGTQDEINYIKFVDFSTEAGYDFVKVYSESVDTPPLGVFTGKSGLNQHFLSGNTYAVTFESDKSTGNRGFNMTYSIAASPDAIPTDLPDNCGGQFNDLGSGSFYTPNYPNDYDPDLLCEYIVGNYPSSHTTQFTFETFETEPALDWVQVWENVANQANATTNFRLLGEYDGVSGLGMSFVSASYFMIIFSSDASVQYTGFLANYNTELPPPTSPSGLSTPSGCGGNMYGSGSFQTPNYPSNYPPNIDCEWTLGNEGQILNVTFYTIQTELCCDYVVVYNCQSKVAVAFYNGNGYINGAQLLMNNCSRVVFHSDDSVSGTGFTAYFNAYDVPSTTPNPFNGCDNLYQSGSGTFTTPNYPSLYPNNAACRWRFDASSPNIAQIYFTAFYFESGYDNVQIFYGGSLFTTLTGSQGYQQTYSNADLTVIFHSDYSVAYAGFSATYIFYNEQDVSTVAGSQSCGYPTDIPQPVFTFASPNFPNNYGNNEYCEWYVGDSSRPYVILQFWTIMTENCCDVITIYDTSTGLQLQQLRGTTYQGGYTFFNINPVTVTFYSDYSVTSSGFNCTATVSDVSPITTFTTGCSGTFDGNIQPSGTITSPNYPSNYGNNEDCIAVFLADPTHRWTLEITSFNLESGFDFLEVYFGEYLQDQLTGTQGNGMFYSTATNTNMTVLFHTDSSVTRQGFSANYNFLSGSPSTTTPDPGACGGTLSANSGTFTSPNYPSNYYNNEYCVWNVGQTGMGVELDFTYFSTEYCCDYLDVYDSINYQLVSHTSGYIPNGFEIVNINPVQLVFYTDYSVTTSGFTCDYTIVDSQPTVNISCGGTYTDFDGSGYFYSPNYPSNYDNNELCQWLLADSTDVYVQFVDFNLEYGWDWVEVYLSGYLTDILTGTNGLGVTYSDPDIGVYFSSDSSVTYPGFQAYYCFNCV